MTPDTLIREPGKFEGEPAYVRDIYWPLWLEGAADEDHIDEYGVPFGVFALDADSVPVRVGRAEPGDSIVLWESEQGFAMSRIMTPEDLAELLDAIAAASTEEGADHA